MKIKLSKKKLFKKIFFRASLLLFLFGCSLYLASFLSESDWILVDSLPDDILSFIGFLFFFIFELGDIIGEFCSYLYGKLRSKKKLPAAAPADPEVQHEG